jgi:hypothetical protein
MSTPFWDFPWITYHQGTKRSPFKRTFEDMSSEGDIPGMDNPTNLEYQT